tara:strand:+ start:317 stop:559 length:243 start_codon:yes stop_codon:yes gene_type:complete
MKRLILTISPIVLALLKVRSFSAHYSQCLEPELDEGRGAGYSCLTSIDENTIGILYEGSQAQITFQKISLSEIINRTSKH